MYFFKAQRKSFSTENALQDSNVLSRELNEFIFAIHTSDIVKIDQILTANKMTFDAYSVFEFLVKYNEIAALLLIIIHNKNVVQATNFLKSLIKNSEKCSAFLILCM